MAHAHSKVAEETKRGVGVETVPALLLLPLPAPLLLLLSAAMRHTPNVLSFAAAEAFTTVPSGASSRRIIGASRPALST